MRVKCWLDKVACLLDLALGTHIGRNIYARFVLVLLNEVVEDVVHQENNTLLFWTFRTFKSTKRQKSPKSPRLFRVDSSFESWHLF